MYKAFQASNHCLHLPILPTLPIFHAVASHSLLVPRNFMPFTARTAAHKPRSSAYKLLSPITLSSLTRTQAGEFSVHKSVLQVTSSNQRFQHTYLLLQAIVCRLPYSVLCLLATLQVWQVRTSRTPAFTHSNRYGVRKVHA